MHHVSAISRQGDKDIFGGRDNGGRRTGNGDKEGVGSRGVDHSPLGRRGFQLDDGIVLDVMVPWTEAAECANSNLPVGCEVNDNTELNMLALVNLAVSIRVVIVLC